MKKKVYKKFKKIRNKLFIKINKFGYFFAYFVIRFCVAKSKVKSVTSSLKGNYNFISKDKFYKIVIYNKEFFKKEIYNINFIQKNHQSLIDFIPKYNYVNSKLFILASCSLLDDPINDKQYCYAKIILQKYNNFSRRNNFKISSMSNFNNGLEIINNIYKLNNKQNICEEIKKILDNFLSNELFNIGPCHGDFHSKNILQNDQNKVFLIDYDCFRTESIQELDALYFIIQKIIDDNPGIWWHEAIHDFENKFLNKEKQYQEFLSKFITQDLNKIILLYFLDRIGQDYLYDKSIDNLNHELIIKTTNKLLDRLYASNNS